jgi:hypothetical protein
MYCYTLKDSNIIQNFVIKILIVTAADNSCSRRSEWDDTLVGTIFTSPVPKDFFAVIVTSPVSQDTVFGMIVT